jgi:hypothetical protein
MTELERLYPTERATRDMLRERITWLRTTTAPVPIYVRGFLGDEIEHLLDQLDARDYDHDHQEGDDPVPDTRAPEGLHA